MQKVPWRTKKRDFSKNAETWKHWLRTKHLPEQCHLCHMLLEHLWLDAKPGHNKHWDDHDSDGLSKEAAKMLKEKKNRENCHAWPWEEIIQSKEKVYIIFNSNLAKEDMGVFLIYIKSGLSTSHRKGSKIIIYLAQIKSKIRCNKTLNKKVSTF